MFRIGHGYDAHKFKEGDAIVIGGVKIPHTRGMAAHSDGDVLIHAICDALLGAAAMGDIGQHFPDTDAQYEGVDSRILLRHVVALLKERDYRVVNIDATIVAQRPKMASHIDTMRDRLAQDIDITKDDINVKATTTEGMGFAGREEGIESHAVVLIGRQQPS